MKTKLAMFVGLSLLVASVLISSCQTVAESNEGEAERTLVKEIPAYPGAIEVGQIGKSYTYATPVVYGDVLAWYDRQIVMDGPEPTPTKEDSQRTASTRLTVKYKESEFAVTVYRDGADDKTYVNIVKQ